MIKLKICRSVPRYISFTRYAPNAHLTAAKANSSYVLLDSGEDRYPKAVNNVIILPANIVVQRPCMAQCTDEIYTPLLFGTLRDTSSTTCVLALSNRIIRDTNNRCMTLFLKRPLCTIRPRTAPARLLYNLKVYRLSPQTL